MMSSMSVKWVMSVACVIGVASSGVAFGHGGGHGGGGHGGHGGGHHSGHHGGHYVGHHGGHYGGHYGGYRGYGYGGYGYGLGYGLSYGLGYGGYYGYPSYGYGGYNNYYSPQYYTSQPVYSNGVVNQVSYANSTYPVNGQVVTSNSQSLVDGGEIVVFSPASNTRDAQYTMNGTSYVLKPGMLQRLRNDRTWTFEMNSGGQLLRYTLSTGYFKMKDSANGMELFSTQDQPTMQNMTNPKSSPAATSPVQTPAPTPTPTPNPVN